MSLRHALVLALVASHAAFASEPVLPAETQAGMNEAAGQQLRAAEAELERVLDALQTKHKGNPEALRRLRQSQAAWVAYREAQSELPWAPSQDNELGSVYPMCVANLKTHLTEARVQELRALLTSEEGDVCASHW